MRHAATAHRSESRLGLRRPRYSSGRHAAKDPLEDSPTEELPIVTGASAPGSRWERLLGRLPVSGGVAAAIVGLGLAPVVAGPLSPISPATSDSGTSSSTTSTYLGSSPLGCEVHDASVGDAPMTTTAPYCTQQVLAEQMCNVRIDDDPSVGYATPNTWAIWRGSTAEVEFYNFGATGGKTFLCANLRTGQAGQVQFTAQEWSDLISVGDQVPWRIAAAIAPRAEVPAYG